MNERQIGEVYLHVSNSGVTFRVLDEGVGPTIEITTSTFGNLQNTMKVYTDPAGLRQIGELFLYAAAHQGYSDQYVCSADGSRGQNAVGKRHQLMSSLVESLQFWDNTEKHDLMKAEDAAHEQMDSKDYPG